MCIKESEKSLRVSGKIDIFANVDAHSGTQVDRATEFGLPVSTVDTTLKS
jgi:hypothetical protein